uniref:Uncharacterized protein n=1 Tax=Desertifilum tharense IPPAS B-1220 TaxID=1781255 RepID=A0ACD5GQB3_9CYAN
MELEVARKRCLDCLINSIEQLQGRSEPDRLEHIAELIILSMSRTLALFPYARAYI